MTLRRDDDGQWAEIVPATCGNGHRLGVGRMTNGMGEHPEQGVRTRTWQCRQCGDVVFADPDERQMPRGQQGPTADYR